MGVVRKTWYRQRLKTGRIELQPVTGRPELPSHAVLAKVPRAASAYQGIVITLVVHTTSQRNECAVGSPGPARLLGRA
jgi:hypothetical protein